MIREYIDLLKLSINVIRRPTTQRDTSYVINEYDGVWGKYEAVLNDAATLDSWLCINSDDNVKGLHNDSGKLKNDSFDSTNFYRRLSWKR